MNTFLPYADFIKSAQTLDWRRLNSQQNEVLTMLRGGWWYHPASRMWQGYFYHLGCYGVVMCKEWAKRGYRNTRQANIVREMLKHKNTGRPPWLGDAAFHRAHQSNLIRKKPEHYGPLFPGVPDDLPYIWPVNGTKSQAAAVAAAAKRPKKISSALLRQR
jgi:hypothetical protein